MMNPEGIGPLLRALRDRSGLTRLQVAEAITRHMGEECSAVNPKNWETERRLPTPHYHEAIAAVYGIPMPEIRKACAATRRTRSLTEHMDSEHTVDRRAFLSAAALAAGAATEPWGRLLAALGGTAMDESTVAALQQTTEGMFDSEEHIPAALMFDRLTGHLDTLTALLPTAGPYRSALLVSVAESAALAGWMAWDMGDHAGAGHYYSAAIQAGEAAGHGPASALALGYASYSASPDRARGMLEAAVGSVRGPGYATAQAWLSARAAEEAARLGDRDGALRALERARTAYDYAQPDGEQAWTRFFRPARLGSMGISTLAQLGDPRLAEAVAETLRQLGDDDAKIRCSVLGDSALGYLASGDPEQAVAVGNRALEATVADDTTMGRMRLQTLAERLPDGAEATDLRERIRAVL